MTTDTGHPPVIRLLSDTAVLPLGGCPAHRRVRADPSLGPALPRPREAPLAALHAVLDLVEHRDWPLERACAHLPPPQRPPITVLGEPVPPVHEGVRRWVHHAARTHLAATAGRTPAPGFRVRQYMPERGSRHRRPYEVRAAGRCYTHGTTDELWVPVPGRLRRTPTDAGVAVAAYVLATGAPVNRNAYAAAPERFHHGAPYPMHRRTPPRRVRVIRLSCLDGTTHVRFDGTPADAEALFAAHGREGLRAALVGGARVPGADCLTCGVLSGCGRLPRTPGLLDLGPAPQRRSWSPTIAREHALCPARAHFHALGLPPAPAGPHPPAPPRNRTFAWPPDTAGPRNRAADDGDLPPGGPADGAVAATVRAWLEQAHRRLPRRACDPFDLPLDPARWACAGRRLLGAPARRAAALLSAHIPLCPLRGLPTGDHIRSGPTLTADDTAADTLVVHRPDVLHHRRGSWIHRSVLIQEEDTEQATGTALLDREPRAALGVLLFAAGAITAGPASAVEVETLTPDGARLDVLDPASPAVLAAARRAVRTLAAPGHHDREHAPAPGPACRTCPYQGWCPCAEGASV